MALGRSTSREMRTFKLNTGRMESFANARTPRNRRTKVACDVRSIIVRSVRAKLSFGAVIGVLVSASLASCTPVHADHEDTSPELEILTQPLGPDATVADAIASVCSTASIRGLGQQLVDEVQCEHPGTFARIDDIDNVELGAAVFPWLQTAAAEALRTVASKRSTATLTLNSAYRTVAQQLMLYKWYRNGRRCGIALAASPGTSNHEDALAVDVANYSEWRSTFQANDFRWLGSSDAVHFDYVGGGETADLGAMSVLAFQRLWNRNNPNDQLSEDGDYGPETEKRILRAPANGFPIGAPCIKNEEPGGEEPGEEPKNGDGGVHEEEENNGRPGKLGTSPRGPLDPEPADLRSDDGGCNAVGAAPTSGALWLVALLWRRRRASA